MDLATIREKLNSWEYSDVKSFVADVRLVFANSDKYNLVCKSTNYCGLELRPGLSCSQVGFCCLADKPLYSGEKTVVLSSGYDLSNG